MPQAPTQNNKAVVTLVIMGIVALILYTVLTMPDQRTAGERIGDAVEALPEGADNAARELEKRTPGERVGDAIKDATDNQ